MSKTYVAISGLNGRDKLYQLNKSCFAKFEKEFGSFRDDWGERHEEAVTWIINNGKFIDYCTSVSI